MKPNVLRRTFKSSLLRQLAALVSGSASVQLVALLAAPFLTRFYSPAEMGMWALYLAVVLTGGSLAAMRLDVAIFVSTEEEYDAIVRAAVSSILVTTCLFAVCVAGLYWASILPSVFGVHIALCLVANVAVFGFFQLIQTMLNHRSNFAMITKVRVVQAALTVCLQLGLGFAGWAAEGLILGTFIGHLYPAVRHWRMVSVRQEGGAWTNLATVARRHWRMPVLNGGATIIDALRLNGLNFVIAGLYSANSLGMYALAWRVVITPSNVLAGALAQVYLPRFSSQRTRSLTRLAAQSAGISASVGLLPFTILLLYGEQIFLFVFGSPWRDAGIVAANLVPYLYMAFITMPLSNIFVVKSRQGVSLAFAVIYAITPIAILVTSDDDLLRATELIGFGMAGLLALYVALVFAVARRGGGVRDQASPGRHV